MCLFLQGLHCPYNTTGTLSVEAGNGKGDSSKQVSSVQRREISRTRKAQFSYLIFCATLGFAFTAFNWEEMTLTSAVLERRSQNHHNDKYV